MSARPAESESAESIREWLRVGGWREPTQVMNRSPVCLAGEPLVCLAHPHEYSPALAHAEVRVGACADAGTHVPSEGFCLQRPSSVLAPVKQQGAGLHDQRLPQLVSDLGVGSGGRQKLHKLSL